MSANIEALSGALTLYGYFRSSAAFRVRIAMNMKGLTPHRQFVHLLRHEQRSDDYRALNPQGAVPTLVHDGRALGQSLAIIEYLNEIVPEPPLLPAGPFERARARQIAQAVACEIHPLCNLRVREYLRDDLNLSGPEQSAWQTHFVGQGLAAVELLAGNGRFCVGDVPTLADICLVPQLYNARRIELDLAPYTKLLRIEKAACELAAFRDAAPENQPDATPAA
ncbi:MAG TPA: maleylacetoacetate isomerase [Rhizomicrobium sp.]|nr:maleylacetoacetate isomerase [Rhizomicrobium sp.]